jgi:hypothetical protein
MSPKPGPGFPSANIVVFFVFNGLRRDVIVRFVDHHCLDVIVRFVDHHCLDVIVH